MKHYTLLKLAPGADPVTAQEKIWKTYRKLDEELDWLNRPVVVRRCEDVASSFDLMATFELDSEAQLEQYLAHPLTKKLAEKLEGLVAERATFDRY
ncbi:MAG: Dabb family protein [Clostridia bacterium]|nr:Dabb family protein [Clostridia bacterium]